jgi:hypothetical protein
MLLGTNRYFTISNYEAAMQNEKLAEAVRIIVSMERKFQIISQHQTNLEKKVNDSIDNTKRIMEQAGILFENAEILN